MSTLASAVHPRVCGEHSSSFMSRLAASGSSPRVRGTPTPASIQCWSTRFIPACAGNTGAPKGLCLGTAVFIPACAGNTRVSARRPRCPTVHPRVCGEHHARPRLRLSQNGSSPRVRGTRWFGRDLRCSHWFIPACAGNTSGRDPRWLCLSVHPRVCGEHVRPPL